MPSISTSRARTRTPIAMAGATEVLVSSANRFALMHELRGAPRAGRSTRCSRSSRRSIWCWSRASSARRIRSSKFIRAVGRQAAAASRDDPNIVAIASDGPVAAQRAGGLARRYRGGRGHPGREGRAARCRDCAGAERLMAQLTDDCFAFGGPLLAIDDVERLIAERVTPVAETETVALRDARGRVLAGRCRRADRSAAVRQFGGRWLRGAARRCRREGRNEARDRRPADRRPRGGAGDRRGRGDPHLHRRADAAGRRHRVHAGGRARRGRAPSIVPPGLKRGANRRLAGEDVRARFGRAACGPPLAAAGFEHGGGARLADACRCGGACVLRSSPPATRSSSRARRCRRPGFTTRTANCCADCWRGSAPR